MAIRWTNYGRLSLIYLLQLRAFEIDSQKVDESTGLFHSSGANKIITGQVNFAFIGPQSGASLLAVSTKPLSPPDYIMIGHVDSGLYSTTVLYLYLLRTFPLRTYL